MLTILGCDHAYKHIGVHTRSTKFAAISPSGPQGEIRPAYLNTKPFGSRRAPANWARVTQFVVVFVLKKVFRVWLGVYVDDLFCPEPELAIESARHVIKELLSLLGPELAPDKEVAARSVTNAPWGANRAVARIRPRGHPVVEIFQDNRRN